MGAKVLVTVEFLGLPRRLSGQTEAQIEVREGATLRDVVVELARLFPSFIGQVITPQADNLISPYFFNVGGRLTATSLAQTVDPGEPLVLMFLEAGG